MKKNYMPEVAQMLGVEIGEEFDILDENGDDRGWNPHRFTKEMMVDRLGGEGSGWLVCYLLTGEYTLRKRPWKPRRDEKYWVVCPDGYIDSWIFGNSESDLALLNMGNCFPSREVASAKKDEMLAKFEEIKKGVLE